MTFITEKFAIDNYEDTKLWLGKSNKEYYDIAFKALYEIKTIGYENILLDFMYNSCNGYNGTKEEFANTLLFKKYIKTYEAFEDLFLYYLKRIAGNKYECKAQPFGPNSDGDIGIRKVGMINDSDWFIIEIKSTRPKSTVKYDNLSKLSISQFNNECGIGKLKKSNINDMFNYFYKFDDSNINVCNKLGVMFFYHDHIVDHIEIRPMPLFMNITSKGKFSCINNGYTIKCCVSSWVSKYNSPLERYNAIKETVKNNIENFDYD